MTKTMLDWFRGNSNGYLIVDGEIRPLDISAYTAANIPDGALFRFNPQEASTIANIQLATKGKSS